MRQEEKELLIKDLCARLPYDVEAQVFNNIEGVSKPVVVNKPVTFNDVDAFVKDDVVIDIKPYLRPMSSMTEDEKQELKNAIYFGYPSDDYDKYGHRGIEVANVRYDDWKNIEFDFEEFCQLED